MDEHQLNYEYDLVVKCAETTVADKQVFLFAITEPAYDTEVKTIWTRPGEPVQPNRVEHHEEVVHWVATDDPYDQSLGLLTRWALWGPMDDFGTGGRMEPATSVAEAIEIFLDPEEDED